MKMSLIIGGSGSGKSEFAEFLCMKEKSKRLYIATMEPFGEEGLQRIERHHQLRRGKGFETIECYTALESVELGHSNYYDVILLECISNLVANELYSPLGRKKPQDHIPLAIDYLLEHCDHLVVVTNNTGEEGLDYGEDMVIYQEELGKVNLKLANKADSLMEVVLGQAIRYKE